MGNSLCDLSKWNSMSDIFVFVSRKHNSVTFLYSAIPNLKFVLMYYSVFSLPIYFLFLLQVTKEICRKPKTLYFIFPLFGFIPPTELAKRQKQKFKVLLLYSQITFKLNLLKTDSADHSEKPKYECKLGDVKALTC